MTIQLTTEQRAVVASQTPGRPIRVEDSQSGRVYWLVSSDDVRSLWTDHVSDAVETGMQSIARGEVVDWNPEAMKELARRAAAGGNSL